MVLHFISDLHLDPRRPGISKVLRGYLEGAAAEADRLYILGDLFELWAGDDVTAPLYAAEIQALRALAERGTAIVFVHGNRDFLCGRQFATQAGLEIVAEPLRLTLPDGSSALALHGDLLCTDDIDYQRFRWARSPLVRGLYSLLPKAMRRRIVDQVRQQTRRQVASKVPDIMDVNEATVAQWFDEHGIARLIHGHTHRPATHRYAADRERVVLADWSDTAGEVLIADDTGLHRQALHAGDR